MNYNVKLKEDLNSSITTLNATNSITPLKGGISINKYGRILIMSIDSISIKDSEAVVPSGYAPSMYIHSIGSNSTDSAPIRVVLMPNGTLLLRSMSNTVISSEKTICVGFVWSK